MRTLNPNLAVWLEGYNKLVAQMKESGFKRTPTNAREALAKLTKDRVTQEPVVEWIQDDIVRGHECDVPVRIYHPSPKDRLPVIVFYHGGGHMAGSVTVYDPICRKLALATRHVVVSVDYRRSPESPYPAGVNDAYNVAKNVWSVLDGRNVNYVKRLSLVGDSGGGALTATISRLAQFDSNLEIAQQALIYPSLDYTMTLGSIEENGTGYFLEKDTVAWCFDNYFHHSENRSQVSPLYGEFTPLLPKTIIFTAEFCPLRDEGIAYFDKVKDAGIDARHIHFDHMIHAFINMEDLVPTECETVYRSIGEFFNQ